MEKLCKICGINIKLTNNFEIKINGINIFHADICVQCRDKILNNIENKQYFELIPIETNQSVKDIIQYIISKHDDIVLQPLHLVELKNDEDKCSKCNMSFSDFAYKQRLGCPECYKHFEEQILEIIIDYQADLVHVGKKPQSVITPEERLKTLKLKLAKAKEMENFDDAENLRKMIECLLAH